MSVVKINAINVPGERREEFEARFAARAGEVSSSPGFEEFVLLRPSDDRDTYLVYTRWRSEDDFQGWVNSPAFAHGHRAHHEQGPVSSHSELWQFDVIQHEDAPAS
jgi:heme-degrading monooxygenase HmoA